MRVVRFLALVVVLNFIRYIIGGLVEGPLVLPYLFAEMDANSGYFNAQFQTFDWITSYFYNFVVWLSIVWVFHLVRPVLHGNDVVRSLKVFSIMWLFFASLSAVYMNHYSHPKWFYFWNILDAFVVFPIVAVANGLLYRRFMDNPVGVAVSGVGE